MRTSLAFFALLLTTTPCFGALIPMASPDEVLSATHLVVRGTVHHETNQVVVTKVYGGAKAPKKIRVENLKKFGGLGSIFIRPEERRKLVWPTQAILFLHQMDGRYWLVDTGAPGWLPAHSSIRYVDADGTILGYMQECNPGPLNLVSERKKLDVFEQEIATLLRERPFPPRPRTPLPPKEANRFYEMIAPWIDFYTRRVLRSPGGADLTKAVADLQTWALEKEGEARNRGVEALLILGQNLGRGIPSRRHAVQAALFELSEKLADESLLPALLAELEEPDVHSDKEMAGKTLVRMGPVAAAKGRDVLVAIVEKHGATLGSRAYWALKYMGFDKEADAAQARRAAKEGK